MQMTLSSACDTPVAKSLASDDIAHFTSRNFVYDFAVLKEIHERNYLFTLLNVQQIFMKLVNFPT